MIVNNWIAKIIVKIAAKITPCTIGVAPWPFIFIYPKDYVTDLSLIAHERVHLKQWKQYWIVGFLPVYVYYHIRYGYKNNPLEIEARAAE